ncbi:hypothetical protein FZW96_16625 [Bacillus sp. BGMRC 2118]|nr:hypothetical protein FZW96_16625 [Bacillus sp. BGMRC 2118]
MLNELASQLNRNDEMPNIELAQKLVTEENGVGIEEIIQNLYAKDKNIQSDCIKVVYEIGKIKPQLISQYAIVFIELLKSKNNRLVWGGMQALATIAKEATDIIMPHLFVLKRAIENGSVITVDKGILTLARLASASKENNKQIFPFLLHHLEFCRPKEVPQHSESILVAVTDDNKEAYLDILGKREQSLSVVQLKRIQKLYKTLHS